jgi:hypothetical protein
MGFSTHLASLKNSVLALNEPSTTLAIYTTRSARDALAGLVYLLVTALQHQLDRLRDVAGVAACADVLDILDCF